MAKKTRRDAEKDDPELVRQARDLSWQGEVAFLRDVAAAASTLIPNRPMPIEDWTRAKGNAFIPANKTTRGGPAVLSAWQRGVTRLLQAFGTDSVVLLKGPRVGATPLSALLVLYYSCWEQCDVLIYERSVATAQEFSKDKLMPILRASTNLRALLRPDGKTGEQDTWDNRELLNGAAIKHRSIHNDDSFKGIRGRFIVGEECGDGDWQAGLNSAEGSKIDRLHRRGQEFADGRVYLSGTPTLLGSCLISAEYEKTDKRVFKMDCPHCAKRQEFKPDIRKVPSKGDAWGPGLRYTLDANGVCDDAWYECENPKCPVRFIDEDFKTRMLETGTFEATAVGQKGKVGCYIWMAHSEDPKATWKHIGEEHDRNFVKGTLDQRKTFTNMFLAKPFDVTPISAMTPTELEARAETWTKADGTRADAPKWALAVFRSIDVQKGTWDDSTRLPRLEMITTCVGANQRHAVIDYQVLSHREIVNRITGEIELVAVEPFTPESTDMVWEALEREFVTEDGRTLRAKWTFVDNADQAEMAQRFCFLERSKQLGVIPIRGDTTERGKVRKSYLPENIRSLHKAKKSGKRYLILGTQAGKDELAYQLQIPAPAPQSWVFADHLPRSFYEGLLAERIDEKTGRWDRISSRNTGEPWDTLVYAYAAERYEMRKNPRLRKIVDDVDPVAIEAALVAKAEAAAAQEAKAPQPDPETPAGTASHNAPVKGQAPEDSRQPVRQVVKRQRRADPQPGDGPSEKVLRARARAGRSGLGW